MAVSAAICVAWNAATKATVARLNAREPDAYQESSIKAEISRITAENERMKAQVQELRMLLLYLDNQAMVNGQGRNVYIINVLEATK